MELRVLGPSLDVRQEISRREDTAYLLLDGARFTDIHAFIYRTEEDPEYIPLYKNTYYESAMEVSPCLVKVKSINSGLFPWYISEGAEERKALLVMSEHPLENLAKHFANFLEAKLPNLKIILFRFYDPGIFNAMAKLHNNKNVVDIMDKCNAVYWNIDGIYKCLS